MNWRTGLSILGGACIGAGIMYFADPVSGRRRASVIRDKAVSGQTKVRHTIAGRSNDLKNRIYGAYSEGRSFIQSRCSKSAGDEEVRRAG